MKKIMTLFLSVLLLLSLAGCGDSSKNALKKAGVSVSETPGAALAKTLTDYRDPNGNFTAKVPEGWAVSTAGFDLIYWIRIYDPDNPDFQVFTLMKNECILADQRTKNFFNQFRNIDYFYRMFADMIVAGSVEEFYGNFMEFCAFASQYEPTYAGFEYPQISNFMVLEKKPYNSFMASVAFDDSLIHGTYTNTLSLAKGEGYFTGSLCTGVVYDTATLNMMYNINAITAPYGLFNEYEDVLTTIFSSIEYTDAFVSTAMTDLAIKAQGSKQLSQILSETSNIITEGWNNRQKSYDVISEKWSDTVLGYERVYDIETGEVYKAYNGFTDIPDIDKYYKPVTDGMYSSPVVGYIVK